MCVKDGTCTPRGVGLHPGGYTRGGYTRSSDFSSLFTRPNSVDVCERRHLHAQGGGVTPGKGYTIVPAPPHTHERLAWARGVIRQLALAKELLE